MNMTDRTKATSDEQSASVARLVNSAQTELVEALDGAMAPFGLSAGQYAILSTLSTGKASTAARICKEISYNPGAMTRMLDRLVQKGMVRRSPYTDDRRSVKLELTDTCKSLFPSIRADATAVIDRFFGVFDPTELEQFESLLTKMLRQR